MGGEFANVYGDSARAAAYAELEFPATYFLAFRDLPALIRQHRPGENGQGQIALDFGCGAGRSTRFLRGLGFQVVGIDISEAMLDEARLRDPQGDYRLVEDRPSCALPQATFDLILSAFAFDNIAGMDRKVSLFQSLRRLLRRGGTIINLVSAPDIYVHEWASFSTKDFPENQTARSGEIVRIVMLDVEDRRPVDDIYCTNADYLEIYRQAGLDLQAVHRPLGRVDEPFAWVSETAVSPWAIYVLAARDELSQPV